MNGSVPNAMNQMANGTNGIQRGPENTVDMKAKLNTCIYDYLLRNGEGDVARALKNSSLTIQTVQSPPQRKNNGEDNGEDTKDDLDTKKPVDLPWPADVPAGATDNSFLLDWFQIFWEMFWAQRKDGPKPGPSTTAYMNYQRDQQVMARQNGMPNGMMGNYPATIRAGQPAMNMVPRPMQQHPNVRNMSQQQQAQHMLLVRQQHQQAQHAQQAQLMHQQQMAREGSDVDMTDPNTLGQNQFNSFQSQNQKKNLDAYSHNMAQTVRQTMPQNMPGQMMAQPNLEELYGPNANNPMRGQMPQNGQPQVQGNHALHDYQMQLMLLEQQNKKRLLMARQEQDQVRPGEQPMGQGGFAPNMSPQGSRSGPSPNPSEQMKRGTPKMGQAGLPGGPNSPMPDASMVHARGSPGAINFSTIDMMQQSMKGVDGMPLGPGMRPPSSHPGFAGGPNQAQMEAIRAQQSGRMPNGASWPQMSQGQVPGMPQGIQQSGQQMGTPQQRNAAMPPPPNVPAQNGVNGRPASPAHSAAAGTPQPASKPAPAKKGKAGKDTKKQPQKKSAAAATPSADDNPPQTPTPATPITPMHQNSFKDGKGVNGVGQPASGQPNAGLSAPAPQIAQPQDVGMLNHFDAMEIEGQPHGSLNMHFGGMDTDEVFEQLDFDAFLDTGDIEGLNFGDVANYGNFESLEAGNGDP